MSNRVASGFDGILAFAREDRQGLGAAREALARTGGAAAGVFDATLAAFQLQQMGKAADSLARLLWRLVDRPETLAMPPAFLPITRVTAARWLLAQGDTAQAARLLAWHVAMRGYAYGTAVDCLVYLERARIEDRRGQADLARQYYRKFLSRYDLPPPSHTQLVEEARIALARMRDPTPATNPPSFQFPGRDSGGSVRSRRQRRAS